MSSQSNLLPERVNEEQTNTEHNEVFSFQALASAIASTQVMKAQQVVKGENGDEVSLSLLFNFMFMGQRV